MSGNYVKQRTVPSFHPFLLNGNIDITYRCNNNCRHCWRVSADYGTKTSELTFAEIKRVINEAKSMGCHRWTIGGGEPMLRPDFKEILGYIIKNSNSYALTTNGTLITPAIAKLMKHEGRKCVSLYGATARVHDHITRNPGSYEATMRGISYLKEAGAKFIAQVIVLKDNYDEFEKMMSLAGSLSSDVKLGGHPLLLSMWEEEKQNKEIRAQRLALPASTRIFRYDYSRFENIGKKHAHNDLHAQKYTYFFTDCVRNNRFYVNPYGKATFCPIIIDPAMHYNLRNGRFDIFWNEFLPSLAHKFKVKREFLQNCAICNKRNICNWCPAIAYLEHHNYSAKIRYFCDITSDMYNDARRLRTSDVRYYKIGGFTIRVESDIQFTDRTYEKKFDTFRIKNTANHDILIRHFFSLPKININDLGECIYNKTPWTIYKKNDSWIYLSGVDTASGRYDKAVICNKTHSRIDVYNDGPIPFLEGKGGALTLSATDQVFIAPFLANHKACYLHASGIDLNGRGCLFVGHSGAGKSTICTFFNRKTKILCEDRIIVRKLDTGFRIFGTWSYDTFSTVSSDSIPLNGIFFLRQAHENRLEPLKDKKKLIPLLLAHMVRAASTPNFWKNEIALLGDLANQVPCYILHFTKSRKVTAVIRKNLASY